MIVLPAKTKHRKLRNYQSGVLIPQDSLFTVQETEFKPQSPALLPQIDTSEIQPETFVTHPPKSATQALASFAHGEICPKHNPIGFVLLS